MEHLRQMIESVVQFLQLYVLKDYSLQQQHPSIVRKADTSLQPLQHLHLFCK